MIYKELIGFNVDHDKSATKDDILISMNILLVSLLHDL